MAIGFGSYAAGAIWDIAIARDSARSYNRDSVRAAASPVVLRGPTGPAPGVALSLTF